MKDNNSKYELKFDLSELYSLEDLKKLFIIIPELSNICSSIRNSNLSQNVKFKLLYNDGSENINTSYYQTKINKFPFFKIIISKLKSYFEINESFIIMKTLTILINEIQNLEKHLTINYNNSKSNLKNEHKNELKIEKENKTTIKYEKKQKIHNKNTASIGAKNNGSSNPFSNIINKITNPYNLNVNKKQKIYFRVLDNSLKKENKTEINTFGSKIKDDKLKNIYMDLNETERKMCNVNEPISNLQKYEYRKKLSKEKTSSQAGLKIYIDPNENDDINSPNFPTNYKINNSYNSRSKKKYIKNIKNKSDLFNNNNNLYINIYEQKKNNPIKIEKIPLNLHSKTQNENYEEKEIEIEKEKEIKKKEIKKKNYIGNNNILNISLLNNIETEDFNIFELDKKVSKKALLLVGCYIFNRFGFHNIVKYSMFENWCRKIEEGYNRKNPYHTDLHAGDITQTGLVFFKVGKINEICKLNQLSKCALFLSCICHDYKHPGVNNNFLRDTNNILAIKYNDNSILENMHISEAFKLTIDYPNCDIFSGMNSDTYRQMRKEMISCVLYTDMTKHKMTIDFMKKIINIRNSINNKKEEKEIDNHQDYMNLLIHSADISNPTKKFDIYWGWAEAIVEEFFQQGDKEKELGLKCSFDRENMTVCQNQIGFIDYVEIPFYSLFVEYFPKLKFLLNNLNNNKKKILAIQEKEKEKVKEIKNQKKDNK